MTKYLSFFIYLFQFKSHDIDIMEELVFLRNITMEDVYYSEETKLNIGYTYPEIIQRPLDSLVFIFGFPQSKSNSWSVIVNFPLTVWTSIFAAAISTILVLWLFALIYKYCQMEDFLTTHVGIIDIAFQVTATLTEPQGLNLFKRWCAGKKAV